MRDKQSDGGAEKREKKTFREQLADQPRTRSADGKAHGKLPLASGAAGEKQVRQIGAGDQQDQRYQCHQEFQRFSEIAVNRGGAARARIAA